MTYKCLEKADRAYENIKLELDGDVVTNVEFTGGCNGNLKAISKLVNGMTVEEIEKKCKGIECGYKGTSCADQLAKAVRAALESSHANNQ